MQMVLALLWCCAQLPAQEHSGRSPELTDQVRGSLNRLQTFDDPNTRDLRQDVDRDREIQQLLPNFRVVAGGSSDRVLRDQAMKTLDDLQLTSSGRESARRVLEGMSLYRRVPEVRFEVDPDTYDYFMGNPDVVVSLWHSLGISAINLQRVRTFQYRMDNPDGTVSDIYYLRRSRDCNVLYCEGEFKSPFLRKPIAASGVLCLHAKFEKQPDGVCFVRHHADAFIAFPNAAVEATAKLISPVSNYIADRNFQEISLFMHTMSLTMARHPGWMQQQLVKMPGLQPSQSQELMQVTLKSYQAHQQRVTAQWGEEATRTR
ncbi:MAG: hypothetical protein R3C12_06295 [Planctomycetaceae bacterium]|nr:hypothetical protein [Planctomycetaceae bacterium]